MKKLALLPLLLLCAFSSFAQDSTAKFPAADFTAQLEKIVCGSQADFADLIGKMVAKGADTTWRSNVTLPGFKYANFGKNKTMIDYAFVAFQPFSKAGDAANYYGEVKKAINALSGNCFKLLQGGVPTVVQGVEKYEVWKSTKAVGYAKNANALLNISLSLDRENEIVINVFLK